MGKKASRPCVLRKPCGACHIDLLPTCTQYHMWPFQGDYYEKLREVAFPEIMAPKDKSYYVLTDTEAPYPDGLPPLGSGTEDLQPLPSELPCTVNLEITDELVRYAAEGQVHSVLLRFRVQGATELDVLSFSLNGQPLPQAPTCLRRINEMYRMTAPRCKLNGHPEIASASLLCKFHDGNMICNPFADW